MSIVKIITGNIFDSTCESVVCPVNSIGVMGAGLAKAFRDNPKFKGSNAAYKDACVKGEIAPGSVYLGVNDFEPENLSYVFYLATKYHWMDDSKMEYVENGLLNLMKALYNYKINSCAIPLLGSGLGHLPESTVQFTMENLFKEDENKERVIEIYRFKK